MTAPTSSRLSSSLVLVGRIVLLLTAAAAVATAVVLSRNTDGARGPRAKSGVPAYACPMHPEVTGTAATVCSICGMALEPVRARPRDEGPAQSVTVASSGQNRLFYDVMFAKTHSVTREMMAPAWTDDDGAVRAVFYNDEIALLGPDETGVFQPAADAAAHGKAATRATGVPVRLAVDPHVPPPPMAGDRATSVVRFTVAAGATPSSGTAGWLKLPTRTRPMLAVPATAIVQSAAGPYVLVASVDRHTFSRRPVRLGRVLFGYAAILDGLREGERVVAMNTFFLDTERRWGARAAGAAEGAAP